MKRKQGEPVWLDREYKNNRALGRKYERVWKENRTEDNRRNYMKQKKLCSEMVISKQTFIPN